MKISSRTILTRTWIALAAAAALTVPSTASADGQVLKHAFGPIPPSYLCVFANIDGVEGAPKCERGVVSGHLHIWADGFTTVRLEVPEVREKCTTANSRISIALKEKASLRVLLTVQRSELYTSEAPLFEMEVTAPPDPQHVSIALCGSGPAPGLP